MSNSPSKRSALLRYGGAAAIMALATLLRFWFDPALSGGGFMFYFVAVIIASWFGGLGPSLATLILSFVLSILLFPTAGDPDPPARALFGVSLFFFTGLTTAMLSESLRAAQRRAEAADRRKDEFLAILAHELRNPLAPISMGLELLRQPGVDATTVAWTHEVIERQVRHLVRLVDDLLDVSRITRGKIELRPRVVELRNIVAGAVETIQPLVDEKRHELAVSLPDEPIKLFVDPVRLAQVIGNLLSNAAKYTPPGGCIWLSGECEGGQAVIVVRDNGIGVSAEMLPHVFDLFAQAKDTGVQGGLGIGLTLVKNLIELSGGTIEARSAGSGKGTELVVRLPLATVEHIGREADKSTVAASAALSEGCHAFVVDDNADAATTLAELLRNEGHEVQVFHDGRSALEAAATAAPDVILLDLGMPEMDGLEVARRLRQMPAMSTCLLIAVTGWGQPADRERTRAAGFDHHLVKPTNAGELRRLLAKREPSPDADDSAALAS